MKKLYIYASIITIALATLSCEEKEWPVPDVKLTSIYSITNVENEGKPFDVYREKPLMIEFKTENKLLMKSYMTSEYVDNSTDSLFNISYKVHIEEKTVQNLDTVIYIDYLINGSKSDSIGVLSITDFLSDTNEVVTDFAIKVAEDEVYN